MREDQIRLAIINLEGNIFERFARELLSREMYPGLNPTSRTHDLGEDARTEPSTCFLHDDKWISLAISKESGWDKVQDDCNRCKETGRQIDILVFVTAGKPDRTDIIEDWKERVRRDYGWELEVRTIEFLAPFASRPQYEDLVDDYLHIPPSGEDFIKVIEEQFNTHSNQIVSKISVSIPGLQYSIPRNEVQTIEEQLKEGKSVVLIGEAGSGKSGIGRSLFENAVIANKPVLFLDARKLGNVRSEMELRGHLGLIGPVVSAITRLAKFRGCRVIIDQFDNSIGLPIADLLIDIVLQLVNQDGIETIIISRKREAHEIRFMDKLTKGGFVELISYPLSEYVVERALIDMNIDNPINDLIILGRNLLNLKIIGKLTETQPEYDWSKPITEVDLWVHYIDMISQTDSELIIAESVQLARLGLQSDNRTFILNHPTTRAQNRLISWDIIVLEEGRIYRFRHEKLQDFLYAKDATEKGFMPKDVLSEVSDEHRTRNIIVLMQEIYRRNGSRFLIDFVKESFNV
jgi:hypothetical protein